MNANAVRPQNLNLPNQFRWYVVDLVREASKHSVGDGWEGWATVERLQADGYDLEYIESEMFRELNVETWKRWAAAVAEAQARIRAKGGKGRCGHCNGTGEYQHVVRVENGKPVSTMSGLCFQCVGKGYWTEADAKRNISYDFFGRRFEI